MLFFSLLFFGVLQETELVGHCYLFSYRVQTTILLETSSQGNNQLFLELNPSQIFAQWQNNRQFFSSFLERKHFILFQVIIAVIMVDPLHHQVLQ